MAANDDIFSLFGAPPAPVKHATPPVQPLSLPKNFGSAVAMAKKLNTLSMTFFLSCSELHLPSVNSTAQSVLRGAMSVLGNTSAKAKLPECMIVVDVKQANRSPMPNIPRYTTEKLRSRNPAFVVGITLDLPATTPPNSQICFNVVLTEDSANGKSVANTSISWLHLLQNYEHGASSVYLPLDSAMTNDAVLTVRFARIHPLSHALLQTQSEVLKCYAFPSSSNPNHLPTLVSEEMAEVLPSVQMPLLFLRHCRQELEGAYHLWRVRYNNARKRLKHFADGDDALSNGCDVFRVAVVAARNLSVPTASLPRRPPVSRSPLSPRGGLDMLKKNSPKRGPSVDDQTPRCGVHPFVMVLFNETESAETPLQHSPWQVVGKTNTEYETLSPQWGTNQNLFICPHSTPRTKHYVSTSLHTKAELDIRQGGQGKQVFLTWFRPSRAQMLSGGLQWDVYCEAEVEGQAPVEIGQVFISLNDLRPLMTPESGTVPGCLAVYTSMWVPILNRQQQSVGELYLDLQIRLTSVPFTFEDENTTHTSKPGQAKADDTPLFRLASSTMDRALRETMHIPSDQETYSIGFLHAHVMELDRQVKELGAMIRVAETRMASHTWFKGSGDKKKRDVQAFATNLHVSYLRKYAWPLSSPKASAKESSQFDLLGLDDPPAKTIEEKPSMVTFSREHPTLCTYATITCGAPTAHALGLDDHGLIGLEDKLVRVHQQLALLSNGVKSLHLNVMVEGGVTSFERPTLVPVEIVDDSEDGDTEEIDEKKPWSLASKARKHVTKTMKLTRQSSDESVGPSAMALREQFESFKYQYYFRKCVCVSQAVSALVTTFLTCLELNMEHKPEILHQWASIGFLIGWESLISSQGKELKMLSDAWATIKCLERFSFLLDPAIDAVRLEEHGADHEGYVIRIPFHGAVIPSGVGLIPVTSVLFTQGINEMQSLANMVGANGVELQSTINNSSFKTLQTYHQKYLKLKLEQDMTTAQLLLDPLMAVVQAENASAKNTRILLEASDVVRRMNGGRVTYCKSGKDRTAMSVTLEQSRLLFKRQGTLNPFLAVHSSPEIVSAEELAAANLMREFGIRIEIAKKNVGRYKYSFNSIQRKLLPEIYRPPSSTIQDMVTSVTARDS
ncbi:inositol-3,4-bisphosphate 4-phosphatase [Thraustotheca clavata]|uniref:Inositol-3,4-bisphosphate 4-phosphatase n=1 Tax=Thraustotheca clavata TaxID=74557 RepID=A0A1V9Y6S3_9STRA|nr:inositol-3,4-bisphosphate 4-phosphatase [Thraustotheca clavata]